MSHWKRIMNEDTHGLFRFFNTKNAPKYQNFYLATQMEHDQSCYFCRGPDDFCWGPAPVGPTLVTGPIRAVRTNERMNEADRHPENVMPSPTRRRALQSSRVQTVYLVIQFQIKFT